MFHILLGDRMNKLNQSLLDFKVMNVERQRRIFVVPWSFNILIALWINDGFLHLFLDFSKSNTFSKI